MLALFAELAVKVNSTQLPAVPDIATQPVPEQPEIEEATLPPEMVAFSASRTNVVDAKFAPVFAFCCVESLCDPDVGCCKAQLINPIIPAAITISNNNLIIFIKPPD